MNCNSDLIATARANVAARQTPANGRAVLRGEWDPVYDGGVCVSGKLVDTEIERLLREPMMTEDSDD
jgi:hypothetical protein